VTFKLRKDGDATKARREISIPGISDKVPGAPDSPESAATVAATPVNESPTSAETAVAAAPGEAGATVVLTPAEETASAGKKKGLRLKAGKATDEAAAAATGGTPATAAEEAEDELAMRPRPATVDGPSTLAAVAAVLAVVGALALLVRLALDFRAYM
jgi:hypothetical protein